MPSTRPTYLAGRRICQRRHNNPIKSLLALVFFSAAARAEPQDFVDLGKEGNIYVTNTFNAYRALHPQGACSSVKPGKRVILTGYGLFSGIPYNISGAVVRSMAEPRFWPESIDLESKDDAPDAAPVYPYLQASDNGAIAFNRSLIIDGEKYQVCFLVLNVIWDLAGAILIHESSLFKPEMILMTGRGDYAASFEAGAINKSSPHPGYYSDGRPANEMNFPQSPWLLPDYPADHVLLSNWDAPALALRNRSAIQELGYEAEGQTTARYGNNFLCNNIAFTALHAAQSDAATHLAGSPSDGFGIILDSPKFEKSPVVGFFHFPWVDSQHPILADYGAGVFEWGKVLARSVKISLQRVPIFPSRMSGSM